MDTLIDTIEVEEMKSQTFIITEKTYGLALETLSHMRQDGSIQVTFHNATDIRKQAQNAVYWCWLPELSRQTGYTEDELHERFKKTYMLRIYFASQENARQMEWVRLYDLIKEDGTKLMIDRALDTISTTWATVSQFAKYLGDIEKFCQSKGLKLPADPNYIKAMAR